MQVEAEPFLTAQMEQHRSIRSLLIVRITRRKAFFQGSQKPFFLAFLHSLLVYSSFLFICRLLRLDRLLYLVGN